MTSTKLDNFLDNFKGLTEKPLKYLTVQNDLKDDIKKLVKSLYDYTKSQENVQKGEKTGALSQLIVQDFDEEQIWQEIELQNSECWNHLVWEVANCITAKSDLLFPVVTSEDKTNNADEINSEISESDSNNFVLEPEDNTSPIKTIKKKVVESMSKVKPSIVDDQFFKLQEMENFLINEEKKQTKDNRAYTDSDESIDMFDDEEYGDGVEEKEAMYSDFFNQDDDLNDIRNEDDVNGHEESEDSDETERNEMSEQEITNKTERKVRFAPVDDSSSDDTSEDKDVSNKNEMGDTNKSDFELRQQRLKKQIHNLEEKILSEAPWQLKGEVDATKRPQNSLLEEVVDFDLTSRPAPVITEQTTETLEDIIKRRIKDKAWDDVIKKEKPVDDQLSFRKTVILDHSKSKLSLAQIYEAEYLKQKQALSGEPEEEKEPEAHTEIKNAMSSLFAKLDALCHYHYTPRALQADVKIVSNTPAISMEEVAPVATSDATLLAPEEIKRKRKGELMSKEERSQTDKNRERRKKKKLQKEKGEVVKVTEHRNTKKGLQADDKSLRTSKAFFQQLNDDSRSMIKKKNNIKNKG